MLGTIHDRAWMPVADFQDPAHTTLGRPLEAVWMHAIEIKDLASTDEPGGLSDDSIDLLHRAWFALGSEGRGHEGHRATIPFCEVIEHIEDTFDLNALPTNELRLAAAGRIAANLEDVVLAIACVRDDSNAWFQLENEIAPLLARMCELRVDETDAMLHAARFLRAVRDRTHDRNEIMDGDLDFDESGEDDGTPCLQDYAGLHPLRSYLGGPLFAMLQDLIRDGLVIATGRAENRMPAGRRLRLAD
ncbi:MAG: hypothetical protein GY895_22930 [Phycisphaera sp.]|nr:hypothetical protein [Phycisphaera sp.]